MAVNPYFNNVGASREQDLLESLVQESIRMHGIDVLYLPRTYHNKDQFHGDDDQSSYDQAILLDMYMLTLDGFGGEGQSLSKFGWEIREQIKLSISKRTFEMEVSQQLSGYIRPREGDLVYFPSNGRIFTITYVSVIPTFYPLGDVPTFEITCELFEYSHEKFNTGIADIDKYQRYTQNVLDYTLTDESGNSLITSDGDYIVSSDIQEVYVPPTEENDIIQSESDQYLNFQTIDPFSANGTF